MEEEKNHTSLARSHSKAVMALSKAVLAVLAAVALLRIEGAQAETPVSIELVLAIDTSISVDV